MNHTHGFSYNLSFYGILFFCLSSDKPLMFIVGGRIVLVTREQHLRTVAEYNNRLEPLMDRLEAEGKWKKIERKIFKGFFLDKEGIMWKYQVL